MDQQRPFSVRRRAVLAAGLGALALAAPAQPAGAVAILVRGMSGGGLAQLDGGEAPRLANFGLFASANQLPDGQTLVLGTIRWVEAGTGLRLESLRVLSCVPMTERPDGAEVRGRMAVNGEGDYPFVVHAIDAGRPGSGLDRIELEVNTARAREGADAPSDEAFAYQAVATLVAGDFQWVIADVEI